MFVRQRAIRHSLPVSRLVPSHTSRLSSRCPLVGSQSPLVGTQRPLTTTTEPQPRRKTTFKALDGFERGHATATSSHVPSEPAPYQLRPFETSTPLQIPEELPTVGDKKLRTNQSAIPGELDELLCLFDACLSVGRLERAALVLKRTDVLGVLGNTAVMHLHNNYLAARVTELEIEPSDGRAEEIDKWFEKHIVDSLPYTPETIGYMLKAALLNSSPRRRLLLVDRYMGLLSGEENMGYLGDILSTEDLSTLSTICPKYSIHEQIQASKNAEEELEVSGAAANLDAYSGTMYGENSVPDVLAVEQKGAGLRTIKNAISLLAKMRDGFDVATLPLPERREFQTLIERDSVEAAISRWREQSESLNAMGLTSAIGNASLNSKISDWHQALEAHIAADLAKVSDSETRSSKSPEDLSRCVYGPVMMQSTPTRLAAIAILAVINRLSFAGGAERGITVSVLVAEIAKHVEDDILIHNLLQKEKEKGAKMKYTQKVARTILKRHHILQHKATQQNALGEDVSRPSIDSEAGLLYGGWPQAVRIKVGATLLAALIDAAKITVVREHPETGQLVSQVQNAFVHTIRLHRGKKLGVVSTNKAVAELLKSEPPSAAVTRHMPMVVEPLPWTKWDKGGYLAYPNAMIRIKHGDREQRIYAEAAIARGDMKQMQLGLDVLGKTAWKVNRNVFNVQLEAWNTGEAIASFPPLHPKFDLPPEPESTADPMKRRLWIKQVKLIENERMGLHSERCFMNFQLEIARAFRDQTFYFPHNLDFRGRAYPIPTYMNHMGADHMRGLLLFAEGRELGEGGLRWLKIQLSNVYGYDKASFPERVEFAEKHRDDIIDSALHPLGGKGWWLTAEDPWQCLAACFELKAAWDLPDPTKFVSHLPVHQDGTCNGLQHYAALGGDVWGAQQVNLIPGERPADVYGAVAEIVAEHIKEDAASGHAIAKCLVGKINRKVVKPSVMTNVYGVTFVGAKAQVLKQLSTLYPDMEKEDGVNTKIAAGYIATLIFRALGTMFRGAHDIQTWLGEIGGRVCQALTYEQLNKIERDANKPDGGKTSKYHGVNKLNTKNKSDIDILKEQFRSTIVWTTPLRMPVVQPYRSSGSRVVPTSIQDLVLEDKKRTDPVHRRKQLQGFPPNFIHSLDASHMMLSALQCHEQGITFAAVHDSFWTHARDVDTMNTVLRDSFIRIHSEDVIGRLKAEFEARHRGSIYLAKLKAGSPAAAAITLLRKQNNGGRFAAIAELLEEKKRQELLRSSDPEKVEEGKKMVTPASIVEDLKEQAGLVAAADALEGLDKEAAIMKETEEMLDAVEVELHATDEVEAGVEAEDVDGALASRGAKDSWGGFYKTVPPHEENNFFKTMMHQLPGRHEKYTQEKTIMVWLPLTFPDIPKKGEFDVQQLRSSKYFFS
ncbi:hypothetical protein QBC35DRAFT_505042 [Podospora australis]|uniref:DNA-directed RNA polymerase n=1 Tax=Podospora australis TaxID=1536484 RepID=A0AAN7ADT3_9PEZI|nr:hypothetical protein QBC35DRAFT_505042 [Podospora australis]